MDEHTRGKLCECGCGTQVVRRFAKGHHFRVPVRWLEEDRGYGTPCWIWQLSLSTGGYGQVGVRHGAKVFNRRAHRVVFQEFRGPIPEGLELDHLCRVRDCVNPDHLEPVTRAENVARGLGGALCTHCAAGHAYTPDNTYVSPQGKRNCRTCQRARSAAYQERQRTLIAGGAR